MNSCVVRLMRLTCQSCPLHWSTLWRLPSVVWGPYVWSDQNSGRIGYWRTTAVNSQLAKYIKLWSRCALSSEMSILKWNYFLHTPEIKLGTSSMGPIVLGVSRWLYFYIIHYSHYAWAMHKSVGYRTWNLVWWELPMIANGLVQDQWSGMSNRMRFVYKHLNLWFILVPPCYLHLLFSPCGWGWVLLYRWQLWLCLHLSAARDILSGCANTHIRTDTTSLRQQQTHQLKWNAFTSLCNSTIITAAKIYLAYAQAEFNLSSCVRIFNLRVNYQSHCCLGLAIMLKM